MGTIRSVCCCLRCRRHQNPFQFSLFAPYFLHLRKNSIIEFHLLCKQQRFLARGIQNGQVRAHLQGGTGQERTNLLGAGSERHKLSNRNTGGSERGENGVDARRDGICEGGVCSVGISRKLIACQASFWISWRESGKKGCTTRIASVRRRRIAQASCRKGRSSLKY